MAIDITSINLPVIIGAGLVDSINPCAFGVLIFLIAFLLKTTKSKAKMVLNGFIYVLGVFLTYLLAGLLILPIIQGLGSFSVWSYRVIGVIVIIAGLIEIKDFFWYGRGFSLSIAPSAAKRIKFYTNKVGDKKITAFILGVFVALVELPCTGAVYLAVLALMAFSGLTISNFNLLLIYNFIFVLPLIAIILAITWGVNIKSMKKWRVDNKKWMRLAIGLILLLMGIWMLYTVSTFTV